MDIEEIMEIKKSLIESIKELHKWELLEEHLNGIRKILYNKIDYDNYYFEDIYDYDEFGELKPYLYLTVNGEHNNKINRLISIISNRIDDLWYNDGPMMFAYDRVADNTRWLLDYYS